MQTEVMKIEDTLVEVTNYEMQNVQALVSPNLMLINRPVEIKKQRYYRLIIWFDYKTLTTNLIFNKDLVIKNFQFELLAKFNNTLEKISTTDSELITRLTLSFDDQQRRIINNNQKNYLTYLIPENYVENNQLNLNYNLKFSTANYKQFLNEDNIGVNRGKIKIDLQGKLVNKIIEIPEIITYLVNDSWRKTNDAIYKILFKKYYLEISELNYVNKTNDLFLKINFEIQKTIPLAILSQNYLAEIIYDIEQNFVSDDIIINNLELKSEEKLTTYYENNTLNLEYTMQKSFNSYEIYLTSQQIFNLDSKKVFKMNKGQLVFNPLVKTTQWIEFDFNLNNKSFKLMMFINDNKKMKLINQARELNYQPGQTFHFDLQNTLTYLEYLQVSDET